MVRLACSSIASFPLRYKPTRCNGLAAKLGPHLPPVVQEHDDGRDRKGYALLWRAPAGHQASGSLLRTSRNKRRSSCFGGSCLYLCRRTLPLWGNTLLDRELIGYAAESAWLCGCCILEVTRSSVNSR